MSDYKQMVRPGVPPGSGHFWLVLAAMLRFEARDVSLMRQRHADLVETVQQPMAAEGVDLKLL